MAARGVLRTTRNQNMKTTKFFLLGAALAVSLTVTPSTKATDLTSQLAKVKENQALANSPRMRELYPELTRNTATSAATASNLNQRDNQLAEIIHNSALGHSPRILEQFPELARSARVNATPIVNTQLAGIRKNSALSHSPRMLEQFPQLAREQGAAPSESNSTTIAPLK